MKKLVPALGLALALTVPAALGGTATSFAAQSHVSRQPAQNCDTTGYSRATCKVVPDDGNFTIKDKGAPGVVLKGAGSPDTADTQIIVAPASAPNPPKGASVFKVVADGPMPTLTPTNKNQQLYKFDPATGKWTKVSAVTGPGIYAVAKKNSKAS